MVAVWWMRSLHLSRREARHLVESMTYSVKWEQVYGMLRKLAAPQSRAFNAPWGGRHGHPRNGPWVAALLCHR